MKDEWEENQKSKIELKKPLSGGAKGAGQRRSLMRARALAAQRQA